MSRLSLVTAAVLAAALHAAPDVSALGRSGAPSGPPQEASPAPQTPQSRQPATHEPQTGQPGKDVIWLPTPEALVERMLTMAQVGPRDVLYDLGSGDGRLVLAAAKRGARAVGVEFNPDLVAFSEGRALAQGVAGKARFVRGDIFETDFSEATVVTLYLLSTLNMRLRPKLLRMRPGTRVVSHLFTMDDWAPDEVSRVDQRPAYLWIVPAQVEGLWRVDLAGGPSLDLALVQTFQRIEGTLTLGPAEVGLREPALRGDAIRFGFVDQAGLWYELDGTVTGDRMAGSFQAAGRKGRFTAVRRQPDSQSLGDEGRPRRRVTLGPGYSMPVLLTNASIVPSGDHDGTFIVP